MWSIIRKAIGSQFGWVPEEEDERMSMSHSSEDVAEDYEPTIKDVLVVKAMLKTALRLPLEIVDSIVDHAEYWPHTSSYIRYEPNLKVSGRDFEGHDVSEDQFLVSPSPSALACPVPLRLTLVRSALHRSVSQGGPLRCKLPRPRRRHQFPTTHQTAPPSETCPVTSAKVPQRLGRHDNL